MATKKTSRKKKTSRGAEPWFLRYHVTLWVVLLSLTALMLIVVLRLPQDHAGHHNSGAKEQVHETVSRPKTVSRPVAVTRSQKSSPPPQVYEEQENSLETRVKEVDLALIQTLVVMGYDPAGLEHGGVEIRMYGGQEYHFQRLDLAPPDDIQGFVTSLKKNVDLLVEGGAVTAGDGNTRLTVKVLGVPTHVITFQKKLRRQKTGTDVIGSAVSSRMVIVVDDLGRSVSAGKRLLDLSFPVTFSVMPHERRTPRVAAMARNAGNELILHLPMEPESYPKTNPGEGALLVGMQPEQIRTLVLEDLRLVPGATGANNHMGSRFTGDRAGMRVVLGLLKERGLFFLDSMTSKDSCVREVEAGTGMPYLRRNIFLDNIRDEKAILFQLRKAESLARKRGRAVAIGHPYPETLRALESWQKMRDPDVVLVKLRDLL